MTLAEVGRIDRFFRFTQFIGCLLLVGGRRPTLASTMEES
jgi:hypothetical protein